MLGVALAEVNLTAEVGGALPGDGQHRGAELDAGDAGIGRIVGQAAAGADGDFEDPAAGAGAEPFPPAGELDFLEEGDLLVVAARGLVPDLLLPCGRVGHALALAVLVMMLVLAEQGRGKSSPRRR